MPRYDPPTLAALPALGRLLLWSGCCLLGVYGLNVLRAALPLALLQPAWLLQLFASLREGAVIPLVGLVVLLLAEAFAPDDRGIATSVRWARRFAVLLAVLFALMVPLQVVVGFNFASREQQQQQRLLDRARALAGGIAEARDEEAMRRAISRLPGAPPIGEGRFDQPLEEVRRALLLQLNPQVKRIEETIAQLRLKNASAQLAGWIGDGATALVFAVAFAAIGQLEPATPTLLQHLGHLLQAAGPAGAMGRSLRNWLAALRSGSRPGAAASSEWLDSLQGSQNPRADRPPRRKPRNPWTDRR